MKLSKSIKVIIASALFVVFMPAMALNLQQAMGNLQTVKEQGFVGEQANGYLGVVENKADAQEIVKLINQARREQYQKMAQENNIALKDVEIMAGQKAIEKTAKNLYIQKDGKWVKK